MKRNWFAKYGWIYLPASWQGTLLVAAFFGFCVLVFVIVDRHSHSASDTLFGVMPFVAPAAILLYWVASKTCRNAT